MACFRSLLRKKSRDKPNILPTKNQSPVPCSKIGVFWEFSYFYYDKQTGNVEKIEACHALPKGGQIELRLNVTCRGEKRSAVEQPITKKSVYVGKEKDECKMTKILSDDASSR